MRIYAIMLLASVGVSAVLTKIVRDSANRYGWAKGPIHGRHSHARPIPRIGGVPVFLTVVGTCGLYLLLRRRFFPGSDLDGLPRMLVPAFGVFLVGLFDDFRSIRPITKLCAQIAAGAFLYFSGFNFAFLQQPTASPWLNIAIGLAVTCFWVALVCNAINLIDGLDGLAAGAALFSMVTIFTVALFDGKQGVALATVVLAGSLLGFLSFNFNPASIFLGDSGSLFLGFTMSALVLAGSTKRLTLSQSIAMPMVALALPLVDTLLSVIRRFLSGHAVFSADREHIHHKLLEVGLTHRQVVMILYGVSAICVVLSLFLLAHSDIVLIPVSGILLIILFFGLRRLDYWEFAEFGRMGRRILQQKLVFARNIAVRKTAAALQNADRQEKVINLLETCLHDDFDGFEIVLDREMLRAEGADTFWTERAESFWRNGYQEKAVFTLELSTPRNRLIGRLSLYRGVSPGWLVDTDLLTVELRSSLVKAIENCMLTGQGKPAKLRDKTAGVAPRPEMETVFKDSSGVRHHL
jgi:UDP-GlcNAc:undecaprenyl-phosphate GlcNAc-1-phosphate transferase